MADEHLHDDALVALAIDDLDGGGRADLLHHLSVCGRCRTGYDEVAAVVERTLAAAPAVEPPPGFDSRVLAALGIEQPTEPAPAATAAASATRPGPSPHAPRWRLAVAAAVAGVALGAGGAGVWTVTQDVAWETPSTSYLTTSRGDRVGTVTRTLLAGEPALLITVSDGRVGMEYLCEVRFADGRRVDVATWRIGSEGNHSWVVPTDAEVAEVVLVAEGGTGPVWSSARL